MAWMAMVKRRKNTSFSLRSRTAERRGGSLSPPEASSSSVCRRTLLQRDRRTGAGGGLTTATRGAMAVASGLAVTTVAGGIRPWATRPTANIAWRQTACDGEGAVLAKLLYYVN